MKVVFDIEANSLRKPSHIWVIVCKDIDSGELHVFREPTSDAKEKERFLEFASRVVLWIGHNCIEYDIPVLMDLLGLVIPDVPAVSVDTLICSRLINFSREGGHSIESYGEEFGVPKDKFNDFKQYSLELENRCVQDVHIGHKIYLKYLKYLNKEEHRPSVLLEHQFQWHVVNVLHNNGFKFNIERAKVLLSEVEEELHELDAEISKAFPPRLKLVREIHPKVTKHGTLSLTDFRWLRNEVGVCDLSDYNGGPFCRCSFVDFNPSSHKQIIGVLHDAGWRPVDKTTTHVELEREVNRARYKREKDFDLEEASAKLEAYSKFGWKVNENNLSTLPDDAPQAARSLAKRILLESRRRTLKEWIELVNPDDGRIHGKFIGIGAWTHRMAHQNPNTANIPNEFDTEGKTKLLGKEMRQLWQAPRNRLLVGVDAEGIQLRIFAHYIDDAEFTHALVSGKKGDKTDPHSLNQRILGSVCKSRAAAKRFIYALLLGAGINKLSQILGCSDDETKEALDRLLERYTGWAALKRDVIPQDARRGWFEGLDHRKVAIPGDTAGERKHLCMSGYLQNGEALVMKLATLKWLKEVSDACEAHEAPDKIASIRQAIRKSPIRLVNFVHDEWQTEAPNNMEVAVWLAEAQSRALREVGEELKLKCPLAGSYYNDDHRDYTIGTNWYTTH